MSDKTATVQSRHRAYESFIKLLLAGDFHPGQFVSQRQLVSITGLPLGAIRELIPRLEVEGLIKTVPQRGLQIAHVDLNLIREAFQFRLFIEREVVAVFCQEASAEILLSLRREHIDWNLHDTIIGSLNNEIIWRKYQTNNIKMRLIDQERFRIAGRVIPVMEEHLKVLEAIETRTPQLAMDAITVHINNARSLALKI